MKTKCVFVVGAVMGLLAGCATPPPWAGPEGTFAHYMTVEASPPGARIETNGQIAGETPITLKIFGNKDGTFHDFGYDFYMLRAIPLATNQFVQTRYFGTGRNYARKDKIPEHLYIDMNQPQPAPVYWPQYGYPSYSPPVYYYSPWYYGPPWYPYYYYGPRVYVAPHRHW
jgi:hypothetical protein